MNPAFKHMATDSADREAFGVAGFGIVRASFDAAAPLCRGRWSEGRLAATSAELGSIIWALLLYRAYLYRRLSSRRGALRSLIIWTDSQNSVNLLSRPLGDDWNSPLVRLAREIQQDISQLGVTARVIWSPRLGPLLALAHIEAKAAVESPGRNTPLPDILLDCLRQSCAMFNSDPRVRPIQ